MTGTAFERVTAALERVTGYHPNGNGNWRCPHHDDEKGSLAVTEGDDRVLLHCHAGCDAERVVEALGLKLADLFDEPMTDTRADTGEWTPYGPAVAVYDYLDEHRVFLYAVCRTAGKQFPVRRHDRSKRYGWAWTLPPDARRVPYHLPELLEGVAAGQVVYVVEGEKDVHAVERAGGVATCNPGGAGKWRDEYAEYFRGATVFVVGDKDQAGRRHALDVAQKLAGVAADVLTVEAAEGKDAADHLAAGLGLEELVHIELEEQLAEASDEDEKSPQLVRIESATRTTEEVKALPPREALIAGVLDVGSLACTYGPSGAGKTFVTLDQALSVSAGVAWHGHDVRPGPVVYVVAEGAAGLGVRISAWEQQHGSPQYRHPLHWVTMPVNLFDRLWVGAFADYCTAREAIAVYFDTLARCSIGADENSAKDIGVVVDNLDRIKRATGACVNVVHHSGKDQAQGARGSSALRAGMDTEVEVKASEMRTTVTVTKQKDGAEAEPMQFDRVVVGSSCVLVPSSGRVSLSGKALETLATLRRIEIPGGVTAKEWLVAVDAAERTFYDHRRLLLDCGQIRNVGTDKRPRYVTSTPEEGG